MLFLLIPLILIRLALVELAGAYSEIEDLNSTDLFLLLMVILILFKFYEMICFCLFYIILFSKPFSFRFYYIFLLSTYFNIDCMIILSKF